MAAAARPLRRLASTLDPSVNLVFASQRAPLGPVAATSAAKKKVTSTSTSTDNNGGLIESRLVIRPRAQNKTNHISMYVSSHDGCTMACKMCHLTATGQTTFRAQSADGITQQLDALCNEFHARRDEATKQQQQQSNTNSTAPANSCRDVNWSPAATYINFMARGEPLMNPLLRDSEQFGRAYDEWNRVLRNRLNIDRMRVNISTIMPRQLLSLVPKGGLQSMFGNRPVALYYSLYSMADEYRNKWMPSAMDPNTALDWIKQWADTDRIVAARNAGIDPATLPTLTFHWPLIKGANDSQKTIDDIATALRARDFHNARFHLIAYNPPPPSKAHPQPGVEADNERYQYAFDTISQCFRDPSKSKRIQRIGFDVHASCGTFFK